MQLKHNPYKLYAKTLKEEISLLETFRLPRALIWKINWNELDKLNRTDHVLSTNMKFFIQLLEFKDRPAIYYFLIKRRVAKKIYEVFSEKKQICSRLRLKGQTDQGYFNLCHVPPYFQSSNCLYVGSVRTDLTSRIKQHLGFDYTGGPGALYLKRVLNQFPESLIMEFRAHILDRKMIYLTEHIESVEYDSKKPILGKRALRKGTDYMELE